MEISAEIFTKLLEIAALRRQNIIIDQVFEKLYIGSKMNSVM